LQPSPRALECVRYSNSNDLWFTIEGTGKVLEFEHLSSPRNEIFLQVFQVINCNQLAQSCPTSLYLSRNSINKTLPTHPSAYYYVRAFTEDNFEVNGELSFTIDCQETSGNDICENAVPMNLDTLLYGTLDLSSTEPLICNNDTTTLAGIWYEFDIHESNNYLFSHTADYSIALSIFEGKCDSLSCISSFTDSDGSIEEMTFLSEGNYLLYLASLSGERAEFTFAITSEVKIIPTLSQWGTIVLSLLILIIMTIKFKEKRIALMQKATKGRRKVA